MTKEALLQQMTEIVYEMGEEDILPIVKNFIDAGYPALDAIQDGLIPGMEKVGQAFADEEYFVTELLFAADTMYLALDALKPYLPQTAPADQLPTVIIGNVKGDTHDIGKNLVKMMLETAGFKLIDLGKDVPNQTFIDAISEHKAAMLCMSSLMSTTMDTMGEVIEDLVKAGIRHQVKVLVGGGPVTEKFAVKIGADGYADNASDAVITAKKLLGIHA